MVYPLSTCLIVLLAFIARCNGKSVSNCKPPSGSTHSQEYVQKRTYKGSIEKKGLILELPPWCVQEENAHDGKPEMTSRIKTKAFHESIPLSQLKRRKRKKNIHGGPSPLPSVIERIHVPSKCDVKRVCEKKCFTYKKKKFCKCMYVRKITCH